jgi:hypothetical protein
MSDGSNPTKWCQDESRKWDLDGSPRRCLNEARYLDKAGRWLCGIHSMDVQAVRLSDLPELLRHTATLTELLRASLCPGSPITKEFLWSWAEKIEALMGVQR